ncbi:HIT family protein [Rhodococcus sp. Eu-32]|nr:HIT family protein [Rhodococcus sp. Eu-32]
MIARVGSPQVTHATAFRGLNRIRNGVTCSSTGLCDRHHKPGCAPTVLAVDNCVFCCIVSGDAPATRVLETDSVLAFLDIRPIARGHVLVVPKTHASDLDDLEPSLGASVFAAGQQLSRAMRRSDLRADGANLVVNDGKAAFQTVFHTHLHVVPRWTGDKLRFATGFVTRRSRRPEETADAIRTGLRRLSEENDA